MRVVDVRRSTWAACWVALVLALPAMADEAETTVQGGIDVAFEDEPLKEAIAILGMLTDTAIEIEGEVPDQRVSAILRDATLEEGLRQVLSELSYVAIRRTDGGVTILALGPAGLQDSLTGQSEVRPPTAPGTSGVTATDSAYQQALSRQVDPGAIELIPPTEAGGYGITRAEFDALMAKRRAKAPSEIEVLPPTEPGGKGLTLAELEELLEHEPTEQPLAEQVPPE